MRFPYWLIILWKNIVWDVYKGQSILPTIKALIFYRKYKVWWQHEICRVYRANVEPTAFYKSFKGLPKMTDTLPLTPSRRATIDYSV